MIRLSLRDLRITHDGASSATPDGVTLDIRGGEVVLLLGPSGSGKSTLALALNGLIPHAVPARLDGTIRVDGLDTAATGVPALSEHVAMVFQDPDAQIVTGTLLDEVCFGPENLLVPVDEVLRRAERALTRVGLWQRRHENPDRLSGGGRQRLAIACALALEAPVIVLDEPTANLDSAGIDDVYAALRELVAAGDKTVLLVEHNLDAAIGFVDRVVVLDSDGRLVADGAVDDVLRGTADLLHRLGVWLPVSTLAALRLRSAGVGIPTLPLTPAELTRTLDAAPALPPLPLPSGPPAPAGGEPIVRVDGLTVRRRGTPILHEVDLQVRTGALLAIVGGNGAGKTTLLQSIAGVVPPPRGRVQVAGLDPATARVRELSARVGFVFQNPEHQFIRHTVVDELAHALRVQRRPEAEIADRADAMLARFGLDGHRDQHPFTLSGGQKRRLSVGTALIGGAPVLALDEPTFGQDRQRATELLDLLAQLHDQGTTVLIVTHDLQLAADYATDIAVMQDGRITAHGSAGEVLASAALESAGLVRPPLSRALRSLRNHPSWRNLARIDDLPGGAR